MDLTARKTLLVCLLSTLAARPAAAQIGDEIPHAPYYIAVQSFYAGEYRDAERALRRETQRGVRAGQARWIDAICYHAMLGEVLYHQGRNAEALAEFDQACQVLLVYPNWLLQVRFQSTTGGPRPDPIRARRIPPWGQSRRQFAPASFPPSEQVLVGDLDAQRTIQEGGVFRAPMLLRVNVVEVMRMSALSIRRRNELLGPLAAHDEITKELSDVLARGNLAPANHWSLAWIDVLRGLAQAGTGRLDEADMLLGRSLVFDGRFDHPLTCVALLEQGRIAMAQGDSGRAAQLLAEAGFSAYYYENWDVLGESILLGWLDHLSSGAGGVYPPLEPVAAWAQLNRLQHLAVKLRLAQAESLLWLGELDAAAGLAEDTSRRLGEMRLGRPGIHQLYVQAATHILRGQLKPGTELLLQALAAQAGAGLRNFQIARTNEMYDARAISPRVAVELYGTLMADPEPANWAIQPLDTMAVLSTPHDAAFDRWLVAALERKEIPLAFEIAERAKRRRFLASRPLGGRPAALRAILEGPAAELSREGVLQRQQILASFPAYRTLADAGQRLADQLRAGPILPGDPANSKSLAALYDDWEKNVNERQLLLAQLAVRRLPTSLEYPPLLAAEPLQQSLRKGEALVVFHAAAGSLYGFLVTQTDAHIWQVRDAGRLRSGIGEFLRALGNFGANRQMSIADLQSDKWRAVAAKMFTSIFTDARLDLAKTTGIIIVPDDVLWYLPFEALVPDGAQPETVLADRVLIRYGPTAALAISNPRPLRRPQRTAIVANPKGTSEAATISDDMLQELDKALPGPVRIPSPLPERPRLVAPLMDSLIQFGEIDGSAEGSFGWPVPKARGAADSGLNAWFALPFGGPERIILSGFTTAAEQGLKGSRRRTSISARPGEEIFQYLCGAMADGARTILLTRWRTGGQTNFELVNEFARELPQVAATEAWQRACLLARETPLEASREPRLKRSDESGELPTADHPFFWAGYLLVDTSPADEDEAEKVDDENDVAADKKVPPPTQPAEQPADGAVEPAAGDKVTDPVGEAARSEVDAAQPAKQ